MRRLLAAYTWLLIGFTYLPIAVIAVYSFNDSPYIGEWRGFTLEWYRLLAGDERAARAVVNSLWVAAASAALGAGLAVPAALAARGRPARVADALVYPPVVVPEIAEAVSFMLLFIALGLPLGPLAVVTGHAAFNVAYAYIVLRPMAGGAWRLAEAARTLGAGPLTALARAALPAAAPGVAAALALAFMMSFTDFTKTLFTRGPGFETLPILVWNRARRPGLNPYSSQTAIAALATILIAVSLVVAVAVTLLLLRPRGDGREGGLRAGVEA